MTQAKQGQRDSINKLSIERGLIPLNFTELTHIISLRP